MGAPELVTWGFLEGVGPPFSKPAGGFGLSWDSVTPATLQMVLFLFRQRLCHLASALPSAEVNRLVLTDTRLRIKESHMSKNPGFGRPVPKRVLDEAECPSLQMGLDRGVGLRGGDIVLRTTRAGGERIL